MDERPIREDATTIDTSPTPPPNASTTDATTEVTLLDAGRAQEYRERWRSVQAGFVDRPRESVEEADRLVIDVVQQLQASFTRAREGLENQWNAGSDVSTEDLRVALQRYRSFFDRLLAA